jgi:hypothetical protein
MQIATPGMHVEPLGVRVEDLAHAEKGTRKDITAAMTAHFAGRRRHDPDAIRKPSCSDTLKEAKGSVIPQMGYFLCRFWSQLLQSFQRQSLSS